MYHIQISSYTGNHFVFVSTDVLTCCTQYSLPCSYNNLNSYLLAPMEVTTINTLQYYIGMSYLHVSLSVPVIKLYSMQIFWRDTVSRWNLNRVAFISCSMWRSTVHYPSEIHYTYKYDRSSSYSLRCIQYARTWPGSVPWLNTDRSQNSKPLHNLRWHFVENISGSCKTQKWLFSIHSVQTWKRWCLF